MKKFLALALLSVVLSACSDDKNPPPYGYASANACANQNYAGYPGAPGAPGAYGQPQGCQPNNPGLSINPDGSCSQRFINDYMSLANNLSRFYQLNWRGQWIQLADVALQACKGFYSVHNNISCSLPGVTPAVPATPGYANPYGNPAATPASYAFNPYVGQGVVGPRMNTGVISGQIFMNDCNNIQQAIYSGRPVY